MPQGPDDGTALGRRDGSAAIGVEEGERLFDRSLVRTAVAAAVSVALVLAAAAIGLVITAAIFTLVALVSCGSSDMVICDKVSL